MVRKHTQCKANASFMKKTCQLSCGVCHPKPSTDNDQCQLYLAESTVPGGGLGLYSATPLQPGDAIPTIADIVIQLNDVDYNDGLRREKHYIAENATDVKLTDVLGAMVWDPSKQTGAEFDAIDIKSLSSGLGTTAKREIRRSGLANVLLGMPEVDSGRLHRLHHAGSGAMSAYHNRAGVALKEIPAGMELFVAYGEDMFDEHEDSSLSSSNDVLDAIFELSGKVDISGFDEDLYDMVVSHLKEKTSLSLPDSLDDAKEMHRFSGLSPEEATAQSVRSIRWLEKNGMCVDNIREGLSTNNEAGRGAFATRSIRKGQVIAPAPVVQVHRKNLELYYQDATGTIDLMGHQLLRNYCFGHEKSSLLLFPYSPVVNYINHNAEAPNAYVRWSKHPLHSTDWLKKSVEDVLNATQPGLIMEVVASRPIAPGEEVFIDYGSEWQAAWEAHTKAWKTLIGEVNETKPYMSATTMNLDLSVPMPTVDEVFPTNLATACYTAIDLEETDDGNTHTWAEPSKPNWITTRRPMHCDVTSRKGEKYTANVHIGNQKTVTIEDMPRSAITFADMDYSKDQYLRGTFRHEIRVPDGIFPKEWMDLDIDDSAGDTCQLYVAESSIPNSGLGMYSLKEIKENEAIFFPEIVIQQQDHEWHNRERHFWFRKRGRNEPMHPRKDRNWLLHMYYWEPRNTLGMFDGEDETQSIIPGLGMLANSHTGLVNALMTRPQVNTAGLHRGVDPGAGAFSAYHKYTYLATRHIPAGMELFAEYGDDWFEERQNKLGVIPLSYDFEEADVILKHFFQFVDGIPNEQNLTESAWDLVYNYLVKTKKMETVLPNDMEVARKEVLETGTAMASVPDVIRSAEWLEKNGLCLDNIKEDASTVKQAGRGAFATRSIKKSSVIAPMPLVHIQRKHMHMYHFDEETDTNYYIGEQLLLNYCYGHKNSSLLFFPYSPSVNFINHDGKSPNAMIRWSSLPNHRSEWLEYSVDELVGEYTAGLILEVVALRDIAPGEEVFIDYGHDWQEAWDAHVRDWKPEESAEDYVSASDLNEVGAPILTEEEQKENPYPENVSLICYVRHDIERKLPRPGPFGNEYEWKNMEKILYYHDNAHPCEILSRDELYGGLSGTIRPEGITYTARVFLDDDEEDEEDDEGTIVHSIPPRAIEFVDLPETKDQYLKNGFRHEIDIPDSIFPKQWMDLPEGIENYDNKMPETGRKDEL